MEIKIFLYKRNGFSPNVLRKIEKLFKINHLAKSLI